MFKSRLILVSFILGCVAVVSIPSNLNAKDKNQTRIIGGEEAKSDAWPFMTAMVSRGSDAFKGQSCGASFIGTRYILTASHCVQGTSADQLDVIVGIHDLKKESSEGQRLKVINIFMHEDFSNPIELDNDVAILELEKDVANITPIKTLTTELLAEIAAGTELTVIGWGNRSTSGQDFPNILHQVVVPLYDREECKKAYPELTDQMLCAGLAEGGKDSCQGDSGGPLRVKKDDEWYQIGVVSYGDGCAVAGKPGVYANVAALRDWIVAKTSGVSLPSVFDKGYVEAGYSGEQVFTLGNFTGAPLNIGNAVIENATNIASSSISSDLCTGQSIAVGSSCSVTVSFTADATGKASLDVKFDTDNSLANTIQSKLSFESLPKAGFNVNEALDTAGIEWFTQSSKGWESQTSNIVEGNNALQSGGIDHGQASVLLAVVDNATKFEISYKVSTEEGYDFFQLYIDGERKISESGAQTSFTKKEYELSANKHRIMFVYAKDGEETSNDDKVYIDNFKLTSNNKAPVANVVNASISAEEGGSVKLDASNSTDPEKDQLSYLWTQSSGTNVTLSNANGASASFIAPDVDTTQTLVFKVVVTDGKGGSSEKTVTVTVSDKPKKSGSGSIGTLWLFGLLLLGRKLRK